jgi:hypothetical protein
MILSGEKKEEYREMSVYYISLFFNWRESGFTREEFLNELIKDNESYLWSYLKDFGDIMYFENGYKKLSERPRFDIYFLSIEINEGFEKWGAEPNKKYFVIKLGKIITKN